MPKKEQHKDFTKGGQDAFKKLYRDYSALVFGIALRYTRCEDDAQDVLQETFIKIHEKRNTFNPKFPLAPWIKKIAINTALGYIRAYYKTVLIGNEEGFNQIPEELQHHEDITDLKNQLLKILAQLPEGYRIVFNLFVIDNLTHKEIAIYLGISESTSRTQFFKAKKMISTILENNKV